MIAGDLTLQTQQSVVNFNNNQDTSRLKRATSYNLPGANQSRYYNQFSQDCSITQLANFRQLLPEDGDYRKEDTVDITRI